MGDGEGEREALLLELTRSLSIQSSIGWRRLLLAILPSHPLPFHLPTSPACLAASLLLHF